MLQVRSAKLSRISPSKSFKDVSHWPSPPSSETQVMPHRRKILIKDFPSKRSGGRHTRSKNRRKATDGCGLESDDQMVRRDRGAMTKVDKLSDKTVCTSRSGRVPGFRMIRPVNETIRRALNYKTYRLINKSLNMKHALPVVYPSRLPVSKFS